jgi:hypothetical protein
MNQLLINKRLYYTISSDQIFHLGQPTKPIYYVDFTYATTSDSKIFVSYFRSNVNWKTRRHLNL